MLNLGTVRPGSTIYIDWDTFDAGTGASITSTGLAVTDIEVYKNWSTTQRSSDAGYTLLDTDGIDLDATTGIQGFSINLADNTVAGFWEAGARYTVVVASVTIDAQTVNFIAARFMIGYEGAIINTSIATLASQTSFTLTAGPAEDDALNGCVVCIHDVASAVQLGYALISDYTGSTKTVTLAAGTTFTAAATDNISIFPPVGVRGVGTAVQTAGDLATLITAVDDLVDTELAAVKTVVDAILVDTDVIGATGAGLTSLATQASVTTIDDFLDTEIAAIKAKTDNLPTDPADASDVAALIDAVDNFVDTEVAAIITMLTGLVPVNGTIGATGNDSTHLHLSGLAWADDGPNSMLVMVKDVSAGVFESKWISDFVNATDLATLGSALSFTPEASVDLYWILAPRADVTGGSGLDAAGVRAAVGLATANLDTQLGAIDDLIDTEITAIDDLLDTEVAAIKTVVDSNAVKLDTIDDFLDTEIAAIKAKTDNLPAAPAATGDIPTAAANAAAVWDEPTAGNTTAGTFGERVTRIPNAAAGGNGGLPTVDGSNYIAGIAGTKNQLDDMNDLSAAQVNAEVDTALDTAIPAATAGSINERIKTMDDADIPARLPAALSGGKMDSVADVTAISGDTTAADRLEAALDGVVAAAVNDAAASTTVFITTLGSAVNDYYNGKILTFTSGALAGQQREILDYVGATQAATVAALTSAPPDTVTFVVT